MPIALGGIHIWHMPTLTDMFGDNSILQFNRRTPSHPQRSTPNTIAHKVVLEACLYR